jgi:hypothetical protein
MFGILKMFFIYGIGILLALLGIFIIIFICYFGVSLFYEESYLFAVLVYKFEGNNDKDLIPKPVNVMDYLVYRIFINKKDRKGDNK